MSETTNVISMYILGILHQQELRGHAYTMVEELLMMCQAEHKGLTQDRFIREKAELIKAGMISQEGRRVYSQSTNSYENAAAAFLAEILPSNTTASVDIPEELTVGEAVLTPEQREAVVMGLTHRLSLIRCLPSAARVAYL